MSDIELGDIKLTPGAIATLACMLEVSAPKPGNVHRGADFEDVTFFDFAASAVVLGNVIETLVDQPLGKTILQSVTQTQHAVGTNTNLGMILLIVPLAKIAAAYPGERLTFERMTDCLNQSTKQDAIDIFRAIRIASPGGLGQSNEMDVNDADSDSIDLLTAMRIAADRDAVARQFADGFVDVIETNVQRIIYARTVFKELPAAIVLAHVIAMAGEPDSLIARKCGIETAQHSQMLARKALEQLQPNWTIDSTGPFELDAFWQAVAELDFWARSDGHRRNPGTTADLIAASLFVAIHNGEIMPPFN